MERSRGLATLPDDVLIAVFGCLDIQERQRVLPLVCTRFRRLCGSPALLRCVTACKSSPTALPWLRSFAQWALATAAPHVQRLELQLPLPDQALSSEEYAEMYGAGVTVVASLSRLTQLEFLAVGGGFANEVTFAQEAAALPPSLTCLLLRSVSPQGSPRLQNCTRLQRLWVSESFDQDYADLQSLTTLHTLRLDASSLPSCLSALTWLRALVLSNAPVISEEAEEGEPQEVAEAVEARRILLPALGTLRQLTRLSLSCLESYLPQPPTQIAGLTQLQRFHWDAADGPADPALPGGPWLASLRVLSLPADVAAANLDVLSSASRLESLDVTSFIYQSYHGNGAPPEHVSMLLSWAAQQPALRRLRLGMNDLHCVHGPQLRTLFGATLDAVARAQRDRPGLVIQTRETTEEMEEGEEEVWDT